MILSLFAAAALLQGPPHIVRAESLLVAGDTAAAVTVLSRVRLDTLLQRDGLAAAYALLWIGRSPEWSQARRYFDDRARPITSWARGGGAAQALTLTALVENDPLILPRPGLMPIARIKDSLRRNQAAEEIRERLQAADGTHGQEMGSMRWAVAEFELVHFSRRLRSALPVLTERDHGDPRCSVSETPWLDIHGMTSCGMPLTLRVLVQADTELSGALGRARQALSGMFADPWPFNEFGIRTLVALELIFGSSDVLVDLNAHLTTLELDDRARATLSAILLTFGGRPDSAGKLMNARLDMFGSLDTTLGPLKDRAILPAASLWQTGWPLYLEPYNERLLVHRARVLASDLFARATPRTLIQEFTRRDDVIRRGIPIALALIRVPPNVQLVPYAHGGTTETLLPASEQSAGISVPLDLALAASSPVSAQPVLSGYVPSHFAVLGDLPHQTMRRRRNGRLLVDFFAQPAPAASERCRYQSGVFLLGSDLKLQRRGGDSLPAGGSPPLHYTVPMETGSYVYSVEVLDTICRVAARARHVITLDAPMPGLALSDLLLVDGQAPAEPQRVAGDLPVIGRAGLEVAPLESMSLYWEVYGVPADRLERDRLRIEVDATDLQRGKVPIARLGEVQASAGRKASDATVGYGTSTPPGDGPLGMSVTIRIGALSGTLLRIRVVVTDERTKARAVSTRSFYVRKKAS